MFKVLVGLLNGMTGEMIKVSVELDMTDLSILFAHNDCEIEFASYEEECRYDEECAFDRAEDMCYEEIQYRESVTTIEIINNALFISNRNYHKTKWVDMYIKPLPITEEDDLRDLEDDKFENGLLDFLDDTDDSDWFDMHDWNA